VVEPTRSPCTEPSPKANCTMPLCRLENMYQPPLTTSVLLPGFGAPPGPRPNFTPQEPLPIQLITKSRWPLVVPPSVSPNISVLAAPSADVTSAIVVLERLVNSPM